MSSATPSNPPIAPSLRVYVETPVEDESRRQIERQLPFLGDLQSGLEQVTGWCTDFQESPRSYRQRQSAKSNTVFGEFSVIDLSPSIQPGDRIAPREQTDWLVRTIDRMIGLIQDDRGMLERATSELAPTVPLPFDSWHWSGTCGYRRGQLVTWGIDPRERVIMLACELIGGDSLSMARTSNALDARFRTQVARGWTDNLLGDLEREIEHKSPLLELSHATIVEFDPLVGHLKTTGTGIEPGRMLLDIPTGQWLALQDEYLSPDQLLVLTPPSIRATIALDPTAIASPDHRPTEWLGDRLAGEPHLVLGRP